jgi:hypothetical protein
VKGTGPTGIVGDGTSIGVNATGVIGVQNGDFIAVSGDGGVVGVKGTGTVAACAGSSNRRAEEVRYAVVPQRLKNGTLPRALPKRMLDRMIGKQTGLLR